MKTIIRRYPHPILWYRVSRKKAQKHKSFPDSFCAFLWLFLSYIVVSFSAIRTRSAKESACIFSIT